MIKGEAKRKAKILNFWHKHGLGATQEAFGISRASIFLWESKLMKSKGKLESLNNQSRRPKTVRKRITPESIEQFILSQRKEHYRLGKEKLAALLKEAGIANLSSSTVGRILNDLKRRNLLPVPVKFSFYARTGKLIERKILKKHKKLRKKDYQPQQGGDLLQLDTIVYFINGLRRYLVTAIDLKSDFAFAYAYSSPSSVNTRDFFKKLREICPFTIQRIQTDNGSEFEKYFREYVEQENIIHFHNYPKCPKMNASIERFNRTIQEEFANWNTNLLSLDIHSFNQKLMTWLIWYNTIRPHHSLGLISPMKYIINSLNLTSQKSNMLWTNTTP